MKTIELQTSIASLAKELQVKFRERAAKYDENNIFVKENYETLKELKIFSALIPVELGGEGWSYTDMCFFLGEIAKGCSSTALALSMHQHLVAANVWKYKQGQGSEELLKKISANQLILVSTGAGDWLSSSGTMQKVEGGYKVTARKNFASQSPVGNILVTSAQYNDPELGQQVLHFGVPFNTTGIKVEDNWQAMGMRGTGSCSVTLEEVFIPEANISLKRPMAEFHPFWNVVLSVAAPIYISPYVGIAERAAELAIEQARKKAESYTPLLLGEMFNSLTTAQVMLKDMISITNNFDFKPLNENGNAMLTRKTVIANECVSVLRKSAEIHGGQSYLNKTSVEKLYRDILAVHFHPLPEKDQHLFTGKFLLGSKLTG